MGVGVIVPDFLVIGAYKSGTTALHHYLRAHPALFVPERKEPSFYAFVGASTPFDHPAAAQSVRDPGAYDRLFAGAAPGQLLGEVSPAYMAVSSACERIVKGAPGARLIAILRDPVGRAYSDYLMYRRDGLEREPTFLQALELQSVRDPANDPTSRYIATGRYAEQLEPYFQAFPRQQLHVLLHEDLRDDRGSALRALFRFLGVDADIALDEQVPANVSGVPASAGLRLAYAARRRAQRFLGPIVPPDLKRRVDAQLQRRLVREPMPAEARDLLTELYREDVQHLAELLGRDLSGWLRSEKP